MNTPRLNPRCPGPPARETPRVRHRLSGREGRISPDPAATGFVSVLFDGESAARSVPARNVVFLDATEPPRR